MRRDKLRKLAKSYAAAEMAYKNFKMEFKTPEEEVEARTNLLMAEFEYERMRDIFQAACDATIEESERRILGDENADI
jgi:predicted kinase